MIKLYDRNGDIRTLDKAYGLRHPDGSRPYKAIVKGMSAKDRDKVEKALSLDNEGVEIG